MAKTEDVFGVRSKLVLSYVERSHVDARFVEALRSDHHVVVYGSSKQGKTSLRQKHLPESQCIIVRCNPRMTILSMYQAVIRQCGVRIETIATETTGTKSAAKVTAGFKAYIPWVGGADSKVEASTGGSSQETITTEFVSYDLEDAQAIGELLVAAGTKKWIVLENYHYLPTETQKAIAFDLKTFHEIGIRFLILGIWREANLLVTHNGDLQGRIAEVPVEPWDTDDFNDVVAKGSGLLNIRLDPSIVRHLEQNSYGNIGLLQEFLKTFCIRSGVVETVSNTKMLESETVLRATLQETLDARRNTLIKNLQGIAAKSRIRRGEAEQPLLLPYYLVLVLLQQDVDKLQEGIDKGQLLSMLRQVHHRDDKDSIRTSDVTNLVTKLPLYQADMNPPVLYYDGNSRRVRVVDNTFFFVLANSDRAELADEVPLPEFEDAGQS
jgi:hypothetical protein